MSISALGGGATTPALQRALREAAERAVGDELALVDGEPQAEGAAGAGVASSPARPAVRRRAAADPDRSEQPSSRLLDAIVVEVGEQGPDEQLEVADGWITPARRGPVETKGVPQPRPSGGADLAPPVPPSAGQRDQPALERPAERPAGRPEQAADQPEPTAQQPEPTEDDTLERLIVVLKRTGIDFRDAYQVLRQIRAGAPLPPKAELRGRWLAADPAAWEERARSAAAGARQSRAQADSASPARTSTPSPTPNPAPNPVPARVHAAPTQAAPTRPASPEPHPHSLARRASDVDLRQTPIDDVIRDRSWHRAHEDAAHSTTTAAPKPTLQSITQHTPVNQAYLAGLSTAEFQRLVTVLGKNAPEWFWDLRGHGGLRGLAERPAIAKLNTTRIAGTRLGAWILAVLGMAMLWYVGLHTGIWW